MTEINPLQSQRLRAYALGHRPAKPAANGEQGAPPPGPPGPPARQPDEVRLSEHALLMARFSVGSDIRHALVDRVRGEIADGTYETNGRLDGALDGLLEELNAQAPRLEIGA